MFSFGSSSCDMFKLLTLLLPLFGMIYLPVLTGWWGIPESFTATLCWLQKLQQTEKSSTWPLSHCLWHGSSLTLQWNLNILSLFRCPGHAQHCNLLHLSKLPWWSVGMEKGSRISAGAAAVSSLLGSWGMQLLIQSGAIWHFTWIRAGAASTVGQEICN